LSKIASCAIAIGGSDVTTFPKKLTKKMRERNQKFYVPGGRHKWNIFRQIETSSILDFKDKVMVKNMFFGYF